MQKGSPMNCGDGEDVRPAAPGLARGLRAVGTLGLAAGSLALAACTAMAPVNPPITQPQAGQGYSVMPLLKRQLPGNNPHALVLLAFSGGGTRAAAFSYGVLEELRRTPIVVQGQTHRFLDEVDLMAGGSGGSFTAAGYARCG